MEIRPGHLTVNFSIQSESSLPSSSQPSESSMLLAAEQNSDRFLNLSGTSQLTVPRWVLHAGCPGIPCPQPRVMVGWRVRESRAVSPARCAWYLLRFHLKMSSVLTGADSTTQTWLGALRAAASEVWGPPLLCSVC